LTVSITYIQPGQIFGEEALVGVTARALHAEAVVQSRVEVIGPARLATWSRRPETLLGLTRALWARLAEAEQKIEHRAAHKVPARVAIALVHLARTAGKRTAGGTRLPDRLTHQALADYIGARRETVSLVMGELRKAGLIILGAGRPRAIVIPDVER